MNSPTRAIVGADVSCVGSWNVVIALPFVIPEIGTPVAVRPRKALGRLLVERAYEHEARLRFRHVTALGGPHGRDPCVLRA